MPHCTLEYSANVVDAINFKTLFRQLHQALVEIEAFPLAGLKSRAVRIQDYFVADGDAAHAYVHLRFCLLTGRDISVRQRIVQTCVRVLQQHFAQTLAAKNCQLSVEVVEMERSTYAKGGEKVS